MNRGRNRKQSKYSPLDKNGFAVGYLMLAPALVLLTIFVMVPLGMAVYYSFFDWQFYQDSIFVGFDNFKMILRTANFRQALWNAIKFTIIIVPMVIILAFLLAHALKVVPRRFSNVIKTAIYVPGIISGIAAGTIFLFMMEYKGGVLNQLVRAITGERVAFLTNVDYATWAVAFPTVWLWLGMNTILMFAGLMNVPEEYYEASAIDGAGFFRKTFYITVPQMRNVLVLMCINLTTLTLQLFDVPLMLTQGGPRNTTLTPILYLYNNYRDPGKSMGYTIAGALLVMLVIALINSLIITLVKSEKTTEG